MTELFITDKSISETYPNASMGILIMRDVIVEAKDNTALRDETLADIKGKYDGLSRNEIKALDPIQAYVAYYKKFGYSYHLMGTVGIGTQRQERTAKRRRAVANDVSMGDKQYAAYRGA